MSEMETLLIDIIQHYPLLYDKGTKDFKDANKKGLAWQNIAAALSCTVEEAQRMWKLLRERYSRERRVIKCLPSGSEASPDGIWPLYYQMSFMEKHIATRKRVSNVSRPSSEASTSGEQSKVTTPLTSPREDASSVWDTYGVIVEETQESVSLNEDEVQEQAESNADGAPPTKKQALHTLSSSAGRATPCSSGQATPTSRARASQPEIIQETLGTINSYLKGVKPDKNSAFGQFVGLTLSEMPMREQNYKKLKIMEILNEPFHE